MSKEITGALFKQMILHGAAAITAQKQAINELNVFPVPDGDTGTTEATGTGSGLIAPLANPNKWALPGGTTGGSTGKSTGMPYSNALSYAKVWSAEGVDSDTIYARLVNMGINDDVAAKVWNAMGW